ncbi:uncharacterized protein At2g39795, mitochondrial [Euphorbia lathyris]|uniref:uncharacterized protein At2g39795, mitochondrial n=1 Tax=Euphorbia lathyris TaxID=212925 RepID=UPI0033139815
MSRFLRTAQHILFPSSSASNLNSLIHVFRPYNHINHHLHSRKPISSLLIQSRPYSTTKSLSESNILRMIHHEIEYNVDYAPPLQPVTKFNSFLVEDRPGEQWMKMRRKFDGIEDIKIEATMFDGYMTVPRLGEDSSGEDLRLHISVLVDICKGDEGDTLEFACSAWPDRLEIQKVYFLRRGDTVGRPCTGPGFRALNPELQKRFGEFLEERGVNDQLSCFLHEYMMNKDRIELIQWFGKLKSFVER